MSVQPKYNFTISKEPDHTVFNYKKTPISYKLINSRLAYIMIIPSAVLAVIIVAPMGKEGIFWGFVLFMFFIALFGGIITFVANLIRTGKTYEFKIGDKEIVVGNKAYDREHIDSFFIQKNYISYQRVYSIHEIIEMSNNKICMRYGTKDIAIAKGLGEKEAEVMFNRIKEII